MDQLHHAQGPSMTGNQVMTRQSDTRFPKPDEPARTRTLQAHQKQQLNSLRRQRELLIEICRIHTTPTVAAEVDRRVLELSQARLDQDMNPVLVVMGQAPITRPAG